MQSTVNDKITFKIQNKIRTNTTKLDSYFVRRTNKKNKKNNKKDINTCTTNRKSLFLSQHNHNKNNNIASNNEPPNIICTKITTVYTKRNTIPNNIIIKRTNHTITIQTKLFQFHETIITKNKRKRARNQKKTNNIREHVYQQNQIIHCESIILFSAMNKYNIAHNNVYNILYVKRENIGRYIFYPNI